MDRLDTLMVFVTVVDEGGFAAAARHLRRSPAAVTRAIAALERRLGTRLLHRSTRTLRLTQAGESYLATCRGVLAELSAADSSVGDEQVAPRGVLSLTSPATFGRLHVRPVMEDFLDAHPGLSLRLLLLDRLVNLVEEGFDAAIRIGHLPNSALFAVKLGQVRRVVCASPTYLERRPPPLRPADLVSLDCIVTSQSAAEEAWSFPVSAGGRRRAVRLRPRLNVNDAWAAVESAVDGRGIIRVLSYQAEAQLRSGRLTRLLQEYEPAPIPVHLLTPAERPPRARIRALIDHAVPAFRSILAKIEATLDAPASPPSRARRMARARRNRRRGC